MKRTTIKLKLSPQTFRREIREEVGEIEVSGYLAETEGIPVVIHRPLQKDAETGRPYIEETGWAVSEPTTGALVRRGFNYQNREQVLSHAQAFVAGKGGRSALEQAMACVQRHGRSIRDYEIKQVA